MTDTKKRIHMLVAPFNFERSSTQSVCVNATGEMSIDADVANAAIRMGYARDLTKKTALKKPAASKTVAPDPDNTVIDESANQPEADS